MIHVTCRVSCIMCLALLGSANYSEGETNSKRVRKQMFNIANSLMIWPYFFGNLIVLLKWIMSFGNIHYNIPWEIYNDKKYFLTTVFFMMTSSSLCNVILLIRGGCHLVTLTTSHQVTLSPYNHATLLPPPPCRIAQTRRRSIWYLVDPAKPRGKHCSSNSGVVY